MQTLKQDWAKGSEYIVHPMDDRMLMLQGAADIVEMASDDIKGGVWVNAMPEDVMESILSIPRERHALIIEKLTDIDSKTGSVQFSDDMREILSDNTLEFVQEVGWQYNQIGDWPAEFFIQRDFGRVGGSKGFHLDTRSADVERQYRGIISISSPEGDRNHETEWIAGNGLTEQDLKVLEREYAQTPLNHLPEIFKSRAQVTSSRDMFLTKGLGDFRYRNKLTDGSMHRVPGFKNDYPDRGEIRFGLVWQRKISIEHDLG